MIDGLSERGNVNHWMLNGGGWFFNIDYDKEKFWLKILPIKQMNFR